MASVSSIPLDQPSRVGSARLVSLDVLRGITIAFMILVNNGGRYAYWPLKHSDWNGWTPTDLVFPTFVFLVGITIVFSTESRLSRGASKKSIALHDLQRFVILFLLGIVVNGFPFFPLGTLRIYGVLQRIAICFLICSFLYLWDRKPTSKIVIAIAALVGYWALMRFVPVPGYGVPGRAMPFMDKTANLAAWLDRHIFPGRLYRGVRDPEGLLSDIPSVATALLGMLTGMWLRTTRSKEQKCLGLLGGGIVLVFLGELWNPWFPINKNLWTSSFVLFCAGVSLLGLALCYWAIEIRGWKKGWTYYWLVFGANAITAYMISELLASGLDAIRLGPGQSLFGWIYEDVFQRIHPFGIGALLYALAFVMVCWLAVWPLYIKKIFIKV
ncbi:MAG TPA: heparan-alpha-glucosaminide N-acetyltransferase domain-containing protein [Acidobacteriaceae bacterium]|nr:heparan-alpha-glucosaminide N-acetyltransferase domain-containing protein [Acidobacteriaceae bacterium]